MHTASFVEAVEVAALHRLRKCLSALMTNPLTGLGIRSDFQVVFDGATIGKVFKSSRDPLVLTGLLISEPATGRIQDILLDAPSHGLDASADQTLALVQGVLASTSPPIDNDTLRRCGACSGTDGAYAPGGPSARRTPGVTVCQKLWSHVGRGDRSVWDDFHRIDKSGAQANNLPPVDAFFP